jgi:putative oxidoreductase
MALLDAIFLSLLFLKPETMDAFFAWLNRNQSIGILILRLFVGFRLIYGVIDNILSWERMLEFEGFLTKVGFPFPLVCAVVSVYAQFIAGVLYIIGWKIRYAALLMIFNFSVAWIMVDRFGSIEQMTPALSMLFCSVLFLFVGAGKIAAEKS